ncbi:MAG TPA: cytochrome c [Phycisphaerales bacterium]|nr:cytochrome c [Phycisphaerales bacterium]
MNRASMCIAGLCVALSGASCSSTRPVPYAVTPVAPPTMADQKPRDYAGLHNVVAYHDGYYSGSVPEGAEGFDSLAGMGIKTIISVDGAAPDVKAAKARGMRYIHLPIGYNGFDTDRKLELVRATRDALKEGPVFVHCHHGKHRSAGAAGTVVASLGWASPDEMVQRMKVSGTAAGYKGLFACTANADVLTEAEINAVPAKFPSVQPPKGFVKSMVEIDELVEHLKAIEKAGWKTPADHPDLVPTAEAGRLGDLLRVCAESDRARSQGSDFAEQLRKNSEQAQAIEDELAVALPDAVKLKAKFAELNATCKSCHTTYRD